MLRWTERSPQDPELLAKQLAQVVLDSIGGVTPVGNAARRESWPALTTWIHHTRLGRAGPGFDCFLRWLNFTVDILSSDETGMPNTKRSWE